MKRLISIAMVFLMLTAMLHLSIATHYCGGHLAALKVSLTGKLASCNMECAEKDSPLTGPRLIPHCCDDVVTFYAIDSNYTPSFSLVSDFYQHDLQVFAIPLALYVKSYTGLIPLYTNVSPPGALMSNSVDLSDICIFRI